MEFNIVQNQINSIKLNDLKKCIQLNKSTLDNKKNELLQDIIELTALVQDCIQHQESLETQKIKKSIMTIFRDVNLIITPDISNRQLIHLILPRFIENEFNSDDIYFINQLNGKINIRNNDSLSKELEEFRMCCYCGKSGNYQWDDILNKQICICKDC